MNTLKHFALAAALALGSTAAHAVTYTVNDAGSGPDSNTSDNTCSTANPPNSTTCTLRAAIMQANAKAGPHTIKFAPAITKIVMSASLPQVTAPTTFDGTTTNAASGGRVEIDGNGVTGCFSLADVMTAVNPTGAKGSTIKNFVIRHCQGDGISLSGHGYTVTGNRIGTNPGATSASSATDANSGAGISLSGTIPVPASVPNLGTQMQTLPQTYAGIVALQASIQSALTVLANPNVISGNVVSGNANNGIFIFGQGTVNTIVAGNIVGLSQDGLSKIPNGRGAGGASNKAGIYVSGTAYGNFIGPGNIVSGNGGHGIALEPGAVILPNFVAGNLVGLGSAPTSVGNSENGITVDTFPKTQGAGANNPTGIAAIIGPANTISDNESTAPSNDLDTEGSDTSGGMIVTGASSNIRIFANVFGLATFPAGSTPIGQLSYGNAGNGLVLTTSANDVRDNLFLANGRHGIVVRGSTVANNFIRGNYIGVSVPTGLSSLVSLGNAGDGIHITGASSSFIGGPASSDANVIAANGRNGIALRNGSSSNGWANLIQRNKIYGNARGGTGIGIDLEHPVNLPDGLDTLDNPGTNYANYDQHRPAICGGPGAPPQCGSVKGPQFDGSGTALYWTVKNRPNSNNTIRIEFFAIPATADNMTFLGEQTVSTDANGLPTGPGCTAGVCATSVGGAVSSVGMSVVATSTDLLLTDVPPTGNQPPQPLSAANNSSEFSDPVVAVRKLAISTPTPLAAGMTGQSYSLTFNAVGGTPPYGNWSISSGAAPTGLSLNPNTGVLSGTPSAAGTYNFSVQVGDAAGDTAVAAFTIMISSTPPLVITTPSPLSSGAVGGIYSQILQASGGVGTASNWQIQTGDVPNGITLDPATGALTGTPTEVGTFTFTVSVTDQQPTTAFKTYTLTIVPAPVPLSITTASPLTNANENVTYDVTLAATGGTGIFVNWAVISGALPAGMTLSAATGNITGKPTVPGAYNFTARVTDTQANMATKAFALTVIAAPPAAATPVFTATPSELDFGRVNIGRSVTANVVLKNVSGTSTAFSVRPASPATGDFVTDPGNCVSPLAAGASCTMTVTFTPSVGHETEFLGSSVVCRPPVINGLCIGVIGSGVSPILARLRFRGVGIGTLAQVAPTRLDFGPQLLGSQSNVMVSITNPTSVGMTYNPILVQSNPGPFTIPAQSCGLGLVSAGGTCTITFRFTPSVIGAVNSSLRLRLSNGDVSEDYDISLLGTGVNTASPSFTSPMSLDFGDVAIGATATIPVVTKNTSGTSVTVNAASFGTADALTWSRVAVSGCGAPIANNATCRNDYSFRPRDPGTFSINTQIAVTGTSINQTVPLSLTGRGVGSLIEVSPVNLDFGQVPVNGDGGGTVTITNTSADSLTRALSGAFPFTYTTTCGSSLPAGASCQINFAFDATGAATGVVETAVTLIYSNSVTGNSQDEQILLRAEVVDGLFANGFE